MCKLVCGSMLLHIRKNRLDVKRDGEWGAVCKGGYTVGGAGWCVGEGAGQLHVYMYMFWN